MKAMDDGVKAVEHYCRPANRSKIYVDLASVGVQICPRDRLWSACLDVAKERDHRLDALVPTKDAVGQVAYLEAARGEVDLGGRSDRIDALTEQSDGVVGNRRNLRRVLHKLRRDSFCLEGLATVGGLAFDPDEFQRRVIATAVNMANKGYGVATDIAAPTVEHS